MFSAGFDEDVVLTAAGVAGENPASTADGIVAVRWQGGRCEIMGSPWQRPTLGHVISDEWSTPPALNESITKRLIAAVLANGRCPKPPASSRR